MSPNFLIIGATGNTGVGVTHELSKLVKESNAYGSYGIIALTRNASGTSAQELAKLPNVQMIEKNWVELTTEWFKEHDIKRLFIASHNDPTQFTDESLVLNYAREAGIEYVVRISTTASNVTPDTTVYYGRAHWAVETMLDQPEFSSIKWTSLRPNIFTNFLTPIVQNWLEKYRKTGEKDPLGIIVEADVPVAVVDPIEVGIIAARLLVSEDYATTHAGKRYTIVGPEDLTGRKMVKILEKHARTTVDNVTYRDLSWLDSNMGMFGFPRYLLHSLASVPPNGINGNCSLKGSPTSPEVLKVYKPQNGALQAIDAALASV